MKASTLLSRYLADLQAWAADIQPGCNVILARDPYHALYALATAPTGFLGVLVSDGGAGAGHKEEPLRQAAFSLYIQVSRPLEANPSKAMLEGSEGGLPPLLDLCEGAIDRIVSLRHPEEDVEDGAMYTGDEAVSVPTDEGPVPLPAYRLKFQITHALDAITPRPVTP